MTNELSKHRRTSGLSPEYALLGFLDRAPAHGYELHQNLIGQLGEIWHVSLSQTYNILTRLEEQGFIYGKTQEQEKRPAKRHFRLTPAGRQRFQEWLSSVSVCSVRAIRTEFLTRLYFLHANNPAEAIRAVETQIAALEEFIEVLKGRKSAVDKNQLFNHMASSLRIHQLESMVELLREFKIQMKP